MSYNVPGETAESDLHAVETSLVDKIAEQYPQSDSSSIPGQSLPGQGSDVAISTKAKSQQRPSSGRSLSASFQQLQVSDQATALDDRAGRPDSGSAWPYQSGATHYHPDPYGHYRFTQGQYPAMHWRPIHPGMGGYGMYTDPRHGMFFDPRFQHMQGMPQHRPGYPIPVAHTIQGGYPGMMSGQYGHMPMPYPQAAVRASSFRQRPSRSLKPESESAELVASHNTLIKITDIEVRDSGYEFDMKEVQSSSETCRKTLMLRNIPNKYSIHMLLEMLDKAHGKGEGELVYDFCYLPIDFKNRCNLGYAFVNFVSAEATVDCFRAFHGKRWNDFNSKKVCEVKYGRVQGREALIEHFKNSKFPSNDIDSLPLLFDKIENEDGSFSIQSVPLHSKQSASAAQQ